MSAELLAASPIALATHTPNTHVNAHTADSSSLAADLRNKAEMYRFIFCHREAKLRRTPSFLLGTFHNRRTANQKSHLAFYLLAESQLMSVHRKFYHFCTQVDPSSCFWKDVEET